MITFTTFVVGYDYVLDQVLSTCITFSLHPQCNHTIRTTTLVHSYRVYIESVPPKKYPTKYSHFCWYFLIETCHQRSTLLILGPTLFNNSSNISGGILRKLKNDCWYSINLSQCPNCSLLSAESQSRTQHDLCCLLSRLLRLLNHRHSTSGPPFSRLTLLFPHSWISLNNFFTKHVFDVNST